MSLLKADPSTSIVTRIASAERLIGTAIQMVFRGWDAFSIRQLASAAHGALQDVKCALQGVMSARDQSQPRDPMLRGVIGLARECHTGSTLPVEITGTCLEELIAKISRLDDLEKLDQLPLHQSHCWAQFRRPYHQVHADAVIVANEQTRILSAGALYVELMNRRPVELDAYELYVFWRASGAFAVLV